VEPRIRELINAAARRVAPGLIEALDLYCRATSEVSVFDALLTSPGTVVEALIKMYSSAEVARLVAKEVLIKPLVGSLHNCSAEESLVDLLIKKPEEFAERLKKVLGLPSPS